MRTAVGLWLAGVPVARSVGVAVGMGEDAGLLLVHIALLLFAGLELLQALGQSKVGGAGALLLTGMAPGDALFHSVARARRVSAQWISPPPPLHRSCCSCSSGRPVAPPAASRPAPWPLSSPIDGSSFAPLEGDHDRLFRGGHRRDATGLLIAFEPSRSWLALAFESGSAFGTVGLSTGRTPELSGGGKATLMVTMLAGRPGPLAIGYVLFRRIPEGGELTVG